MARLVKKNPFSEDDLKKMETLYGQGMKQEDIAWYFGYNPTYFSEIKGKFPEIAEAFKKGKSKVKAFVMGKLFEHIKKGNIVSLLFFLKVQCGWNEHNPQPNDPDDAASLTKEDFEKLFEKMPLDVKIKAMAKIVEEMKGLGGNDGRIDKAKA